MVVLTIILLILVFIISFFLGIMSMEYVTKKQTGMSTNEIWEKYKI